MAIVLLFTFIMEVAAINVALYLSTSLSRNYKMKLSNPSSLPACSLIKTRSIAHSVAEFFTPLHQPGGKSRAIPSVSFLNKSVSAAVERGGSVFLADLFSDEIVKVFHLPRILSGVISAFVLKWPEAFALMKWKPSVIFASTYALADHQKYNKGAFDLCHWRLDTPVQTTSRMNTLKGHGNFWIFIHRWFFSY